MSRRSISILGSTGSIGVSALDIIGRYPDRFRVASLAAGSNVGLLVGQIEKFSPNYVSVKDERARDELRKNCPSSVEIFVGTDGAVRVATDPGSDTVLSAMVGSVGLKPTYEAIKAGKRIALANKEVLVVAGELMMSEARRRGAEILPVDSEHSAVFQSIAGNRREDIRRIILTASGGPFLNFSGDLSNVTVEDALNHPNWSMGKKITIDSATMMNKGLEIVEAHWLFDLPEERIGVVIHPQSIVHSMVEYNDGSVIAEMGVPDMRGPISYALGYPERVSGSIDFVNFTRVGELTFLEPDHNKFPMLGLARNAIRNGGSMPAVMNAANEVAVDAFLNRRIGFLDMYNVVSGVMDNCEARSFDSIEEVLTIDMQARKSAEREIAKR